MQEGLSGGDGGAYVDLLPDHYTHDGSLNNPLHPRRGANGTPRIRAHPPLHSYLDLDDDDDDGGHGEPLWHHPRLDLPSARRILVELFQKVMPRKNERASQLLMAVGQFVTRDITRTSAFDQSRPIPIECDMVETRGPFCPAGQEHMDLFRAIRETGDIGTGEPINFATTWLDMDQVYGSEPPGSRDYLKFRTGSGGRMKLDDSTGVPPIDPDTGFYLVADNGVRLLPAGMALLSTFLRYHNRRAGHHSELHPELDDEALFHKARMDVVAVYQATVEEKYLTAVLGDPLETYTGYDPETDASIDIFFSTCSFRYGHSGTSGVQRLLDAEWEPLPQDPMLMRDLFDRTEDFVHSLEGGGKNDSALAAVLRGLAHDVTRALDASFVDDMSLFMNGPVPKNIQRGRDVGLPSYNDAREWFGLGRVASYLELAGGDEAVATVLEDLYGEGRVDDVDAYVGAMLEEPATKHDELGPLNKESILDQFTRLRDGDRLYYRARLEPDEIENLPLLSELIRDEWGKDEMANFPVDLFMVRQGGERAVEAGGAMELLGGDFSVNWKMGEEQEHIDFTMHVHEMVSGGYIGFGWGSNTMRGAEIWFCKSEPEEPKLLMEACVAMDPPEIPLEHRGPFNCCIAPGKQHVEPICGDNNYLTVMDSCASNMGSYVTVRAKLCSSPGVEGDGCFSHEGDLDFIASYNPDDYRAAHGFSRRTSGTTNLSLGTVLSCSDDSAQAGLFALHGATILFAWLILAPIAIFIVRYLKEKPWRLRVHIELASIIGGLMLTLVTAALVSVEGTSFGTEDAESATFSTHKIFGLSIVTIVVFMISTGELRRRRAFSNVAVEKAIIIAHKWGGLLLTGLAWYNCYTGLIQIGPYEADTIEVTFGSSKTVALGYNLEFFGFVRKYLFFPWLCVVILFFAITEFRVRRAHALETERRIDGNILTIDNIDDLPDMSIETFLFLTKHGNSLCIIDGFVIDIGRFMDVHPGGSNVLRFAIGSDITAYFIGELGVRGRMHKHSPNALKALRPLVKSKLEDENNNGLTSSGTLKDTMMSAFRQPTPMPKMPALLRQQTITSHVFRLATVVHNEVVAQVVAPNEKNTIQLTISLERDEQLDVVLGAPLPSATFIFRAIDDKGNAFERPYSAARCLLPVNSYSRNTALPLYRNGRKKGGADKIVYEFFITIVPGGKMSTFLSTRMEGKHFMVKGPLLNRTLLERLSHCEVVKDVCLIAKETCSPALQLIDYYLRMPPENVPRITLLWLVKARHSSFEHALNLPDREALSKRFRYMILSDEEDTVSKDATKQFQCTISSDSKDEETGDSTEEDEARQAFLQLYYSKGISYNETASALLYWILCAKCSDEDDRRTLFSPVSTNTYESQLGRSEDSTLDKLATISESFISGLKPLCRNQSLRGCDIVSFLVEEGYTPTRESALILGRELATKLNLFEHTRDDQRWLFDDEDEYYKLNVNSGFRAKRSALQFELKESLIVGLCGHSSFDQKMSDVLRQVGLVDEIIFQFFEGSVPMSMLPEFAPQQT